MINNSILYMTKGNRSTTLYYKDKTINVEHTMESLLEEVLNESLTTLRGRLISTSIVFHIRKYVPIYINQKFILFPINNKGSWDETLINYNQVLSFNKVGEKTLIVFKTGNSLLVELSVKKLYNILENCKAITNKQFIIERNNIYG